MEGIRAHPHDVVAPSPRDRVSWTGGVGEAGR